MELASNHPLADTASQRTHGELAVKEALMSNFLTEFDILLYEKEGILELLN